MIPRSQPDAASLGPMDLRAALREYFGFSNFRAGQAEVCEALLAGRDTLAVMPTGAGKSLCFQLPSLLLAETTVVISPLVALMKDQLDGLPEAFAGRATLINSTLDAADQRSRLGRLAAGRLKLVYVAPERLGKPDFLAALRQAGVSRVVIDEAHCVSAWGHDFRPDYLAIGRALRRLGGPPVLALTATAPAPVREDISEQLGRRLDLLQVPFFRPNLHYAVATAPTLAEKDRLVLATCRKTSGSGIVYARARRRTVEVAAYLQENGIEAASYHAGLEPKERSRIQDAFMAGRVRVVVATVAFGMGVDKPDVRFVVHSDLPASLESYAQESGRAGRDGQAAHCLLLYGLGERDRLEYWLREERLDVEYARAVYRLVRAQLGPERQGYLDPRTLLANAPAGELTRVRLALSLLERAGLLETAEDNDRLVSLPEPPAGADRRMRELLSRYAEAQERRIDDIVGYAESRSCRHARLAAHFDQAVPSPCGACDVCNARPGQATRISAGRQPMAGQVANPESAVLGCLAGSPVPLGRSGLIEILSGSASVGPAGRDSPYYGALRHLSPRAIENLIDRLLAEGRLRRPSDPTPGRHSAGRRASTNGRG